MFLERHLWCIMPYSVLSGLSESIPGYCAGWVRAVLYLLAMLYLFLGVNIALPACDDELSDDKLRDFAK